MKVLVTGATGFVGRALCAHLCRYGLGVRMAVHNPNHGLSDAVAVGEIGTDTDWHDKLSGIDVVALLAAREYVLRDTALDSLAEYQLMNVEAAAAGVPAVASRIYSITEAMVEGQTGFFCTARETWQIRRVICRASSATFRCWTIWHRRPASARCRHSRRRG